jgi:amidase, hydantoinase/carbamoylase family
MQQVNTHVADWMRAAGMVVHLDQIGNIIGRYGAQADSANKAPTLLLGSHLDTVRDAGKYDGILGVMLAIALVERLHERQRRLPFALEVIGFADEEGTRYHHPYLGSTALAGTFDTQALQLTDSDGISLATALRQFGGDPDALYAARRDPANLLGYCEVHIEQGPILENEGLPVGIVTAITGQSRIEVTFHGQAGHAGTVPMTMRHDALCAAASFILTTEYSALAIPGLVATIGQIAVQPGASNVIPGQAILSLDVRHPDNAERISFCQRLQQQAHQIAHKRQVTVVWNERTSEQTITCSARLSQLLATAIAQQGYKARFLPSGAGHDAAIMATLTESCMLFVRCRHGISHHPAEAVALTDVVAALTVMEHFLQSLTQLTP